MTMRKTRAKKLPAEKMTRKVEARATPPKGKKPTRTVAEARGLTHRDAVIASKPSEPNARESSAVTTFVNQHFGLWSTMLRMSPVPFVLRQQIAVAKLFMAFMLPTGRPADESKADGGSRGQDHLKNKKGRSGQRRGVVG
jgi:hypothetical protein